MAAALSAPLLAALAPDERDRLDAALLAAGGAAAATLREERDVAEEAVAEEAAALAATHREALVARAEPWACAWREAHDWGAEAQAAMEHAQQTARRHANSAVAHAVVGSCFGVPTSSRDGAALVYTGAGERGMDASASDTLASLASRGSVASPCAPEGVDLCAGAAGEVHLPLSTAPLAEKLRDVAAALAGATKRVTAKKESQALAVETARASGTRAQAAAARVSTSAREHFVQIAEAAVLDGDERKARAPVTLRPTFWPDNLLTT